MWNKKIKNKISIIIPCYRENYNIIQFIISDLLNKFNYLEIIISDWSYSYEVEKKIWKYENVIYLNNIKKTRSSGMNLGAKNASWDILLFLHVDTILPQETGTILTNIDLEKYNYWGFYKKFTHNTFWLILNSFFTNYKLKYFWSLLWDNSIFISKELFRKIWGFADISLMEDVEISLKLKKYWKIKVIKIPCKTSSRKFIKNGVVKTIIFMQYIRILYFFWISTDILNEKYRQFWKK